MNKVTVTVSGLVGSGKTTIMQIIDDALCRAGFIVNVNDIDGPWVGAMTSTDNIYNRVKSLTSDGIEIDLNSFQEHREISTKD